MNEEAGKGKIDRLPFALREEVCVRLRDNQTAMAICAWLNGLPEVLQMLDEHFHEQPISQQNVSNFRSGGYRKWLNRISRVDETRAMAKFSMDLATASGGKLADGAAQILAGNILGLLEDLEEAKEAPERETPEARHTRLGVIAESLDSLTAAVQRLRKGDQNAEVLRQRERQLAQKDEDLRMEREKWDLKLAEIAEQKKAITNTISAARLKGGLTPEALKEIEQAVAIL